MRIQRVVACAALLCTLKAIAVEPTFQQNYVPVVLVNNTGGVSDSNLYFLAHGLDNCGLPCFLVPDGTDFPGQCTYHYPTVSGTPGSADPLISKTFSQLPMASGTNVPANARLIYLPIDSASRGYISVYNPMYLPTAYNPAPSRMVLDILDSSVTTIRDANYYTLYQDFEFGLVPLVFYSGGGVALGSSYGTQLFLNLSWVDYFALPMELQVWSYVTHQPIPSTAMNNFATPTSGTLANLSREQVIQNMQMKFQNAPPQGQAAWEALTVPLYANPYAGTGTPPTLRILAAKNSISLESGAGFAAANPVETFFPADYVHNAVYGTNFMSDAYTYFLTGANTLYCRIIPANPEPGKQYKYSVTSVPSDANLNLKFTYYGDMIGGGYAVPDTELQLSLLNLTTEQLLSGSEWPFTTDGTTPAGAGQTSFTNELSKMISALFTIGLFPSNLATTSAAPFLVSDTGFAGLPDGANGNAYFNNPAFAGGYWYNLYDEALHEDLIKTDSPANNPDYGLGYGYDYDDVLNLAGLVQPIIQNQYGNVEANQPYIVITMGSLVGTPVININTDKYTTNQSGISGYQTIPYPIQVGPLAAGTETVVTFMWYDNTGGVWTPHTTPAPTAGNTQLTNLSVDATHPFQVEFQYTINSVLQTYTFNINALRQLATPESPSSPYSTIEQTYIDGIVFTLQTVPSNYLLLAVNSTTPPWPG